MAIAATQESPAAGATRKPLMTNKQILFMNFGFFGVQYSFGMQQTAVNPISTRAKSPSSEQVTSLIY